MGLYSQPDAFTERTLDMYLVPRVDYHFQLRGACMVRRLATTAERQEITEFSALTGGPVARVTFHAPCGVRIVRFYDYRYGALPFHRTGRGRLIGALI